MVALSLDKTICQKEDPLRSHATVRIEEEEPTSVEAKKRRSEEKKY